MDVEKSVDILRHIVQQKPYRDSLSESDYHLLRDNQLSGSLYPLIKEQNHLVKGFKEDYYRYIQRDTVQIDILENLRQIFFEHQIDFVFLKGAYLKTIYPYSFMRPMGDIDLLIRSHHMDKVHQILEANGFSNWNNSTNHDCFMKRGVNVEVHPHLDSSFSDEYGDFFMNPWQYAIKINHTEYDLEVAYRFLYQIYHMIKHLYHSGVGLRTFIDLYYLYEQIDPLSDEFKGLVDCFPKKQFVEFIQEVIDYLFSDKPLNVSANYDRINVTKRERLLHYILHSGAHGIGEEHNLFIGGIASTRRQKEWMIWTKVKFVFRKTFPPYSQMKGVYLYLKKFPLLLPFAYMQRLLKLVFKKSSRHKLTHLKVDKNDVEYVEKLFKDIGIIN